MKKITHINFAKGFRGGERQTLLLIVELTKRGYSQRVLTRQNSTLAKRLEGVENLEIIELPKPYIFSLSKIKEASLLHAHETKGAQFAFWGHLRYKIPYIVTRRVDKSIKNNFFNQALYKNALTSVVLSTAIQKRLFKLNTQLNTTIIPSAITDFELHQEKIDNIKIRFKDKFVIGVIGALEYGKGQKYIIEIAPKIAQNYPDIHFLFLGTGKNEEEFKAQSQNISNITFEGFVDNVGDYIACLDLFVFPTLSEGLGSILLDVMNFNVPIIASNVGGIPDIIQDKQNGILLPPKESDAIYQAIKRLYEDSNLREALATRAKQSVENYSPQKMADRYEKIYKGVI